MAFYQFSTEQTIRAPRDTVWDFISSPANLKIITPDYMGFKITSGKLPEKMHAGMIISYKVSPVLGIRMNWLTEITQVVDKVYFVDEQRIGPYAFWHHQHRLEEASEGTMMRDVITYAPPFGFLGKIANGLMISRKLKEIFNYREKAITEYFK